MRNPVEEYCLALLLQYPELSNAAQELSVEHFENPVNREIFAQWRCYGDNTEMKKQIAPSLLEHLDYLLGKPILEQTTSKQQYALSDCVLRLQERKLKKREAEKAIMLEVTREQEGTAAELAKLDEQGTSSSEQIMAVQLKRREITRG
jgi:hypothetical protein